MNFRNESHPLWGIRLTRRVCGWATGAALLGMIGVSLIEMGVRL